MPIATAVQVGDFVNYHAGVWKEEDFNKIINSAGSPTVNKSTSLPTTQGEFGGFTIGQSRNSNSTPANSDYIPKYSGWRVWDIEEGTGEITLISAGHPETYWHDYGQSSASINILRNRNCSMYENEYAKEGSAHILTGQEAATWYNKQFGTNYTIVDNVATSSTFFAKHFTTNYPIEVFENGSFYWLASPYNSNTLYHVYPNFRYVHYSRGYYVNGVRVLVSLMSGVQVKSAGETGGVTTWDIVGN